MLPKDVNGSEMRQQPLESAFGNGSYRQKKPPTNGWTAAEEAYRLLHDADKARTSPGSEVRIRLATGCWRCYLELRDSFKYL